MAKRSKVDQEADTLARGAGQPVNPAPAAEELNDADASRVAVDVEGLPYDPAIHKSKADGSPLVQRVAGGYRLQRKPGRKPMAGGVGKASRVAPPGSDPGPKDPAEMGSPEPKAPGAGAVAVRVLERFGRLKLRDGGPGSTPPKPWGGEMDDEERMLISLSGDAWAAQSGTTFEPKHIFLAVLGQYLVRVYLEVEDRRERREIREAAAKAAAIPAAAA